MNDQWWVKYEAKIMLVDTVGMRPDTELAHRRLCDVIWATGETPMDDDDVLPDICRVKAVDWVRVKGELQTKGWRTEAGRFTHLGAAGLVKASLEQTQKLSAAGRAGATARHRKPAPAQRPQPEPHSDRTATAPPTAMPLHCEKHGILESESESESEGSDKVSKLRTEGGTRGKPLRGRQADIAALGESVLNGEWVNDAGKWVERIRSDPEKVWRVFCDVKAAATEGRIKTTPARMAEHNWKVFM